MFVRLFREKREEGVDYIDYIDDYVASIDESRILILEQVFSFP